MNKSIKLIQLNKGDSNFENIIYQFKFIIKQQNPQIIVLNELNMKSTDMCLKSQFPNFRFEMDKLDKTD